MVLILARHQEISCSSESPCQQTTALQAAAGSSMVKLSCRAGVCKARLPLVSRRGWLLTAKCPIWGACGRWTLLPRPVLRSGEGGGTGRFHISPSCSSALPRSPPQSSPIIMETGDGASKSRARGHRGALLHCPPSPGRQAASAAPGHLPKQSSASVVACLVPS